MKPGDKVKIVRDFNLLEKHGIQALWDIPELFDMVFTVKYFSYNYASLLEEEVWDRDFHFETLIKQ